VHARHRNEADRGEYGPLTIFHLKIELRKKDYGCLYEQRNFFSDVFPALETAVESGIRAIGIMIDAQRAKDPFYKDESIETFVKEALIYRFEVCEFDPETRYRKKPPLQGA
jgi:hypothetical protein